MSPRLAGASRLRHPWQHCTPAVRQIPENPQEWEASVGLAGDWLFTRQTLRLKDAH